MKRNAARRERWRDRVVTLFVLLAMGAACLVLWIGLPVAVLWALSKLARSAVIHGALGVVLVPAAMVAFAPILFWLNWQYLRITGALARLEEDQSEAGWSRRIGGPLEPMLIASLGIALVALAVWFFLYAENPSRQVI